MPLTATMIYNQIREWPGKQVCGLATLTAVVHRSLLILKGDLFSQWDGWYRSRCDEH